MSFILVIAIIAYIGAAFFVSYISAIYMMKETEPDIFGTNVFVSTMINLLLVAIATFCWFVYSWVIKEELFLNGLYLGLGLFFVSEVILIVTLYGRRKKIEYTLQSGRSEESLQYFYKIKSFVKKKVVQLRG